MKEYQNNVNLATQIKLIRLPNTFFNIYLKMHHEARYIRIDSQWAKLPPTNRK